jgi:hypothetical protein
MALLEGAVEGLAEGGAATGLAIGVGAVMLIPGVLPALGSVMRSIAVGAIKTGMVVYNQTAATVRETTGDLVAEARAQLEAEHQDRATGSDRVTAPASRRGEAHA